MTYASTHRAVDQLPRSRLWGIGTYEVDGTSRDLPLGWDDIERDSRWAARLLEAHGLGPGDEILVTSGGWEAPWYWPVARGALGLGATYAASEVWAFDARRCAMFLRRLGPRFVVGLGLAVVRRLQDLGDLHGLLADAVVLARPEAHGVLEQAGIRPYAVSPLGPALGIEPPDRRGLFVDGDEWHLEALQGRLHITTSGPRAHRVERQPIGLRGRVERPDPRVPGVVVHPEWPT